MFTVTEPIETERLLLRPYRATDVDRVLALRSDPATTRWVPLKVSTRDEAVDLLARRVTMVSLAANDDALALAAVRKDDGLLVGEMTLWLRDAEHRQGEVGYVFDPVVHGQGLATEASGALLELAFTTLGLHRVFANAYAANAPSLAVMRRLGMREEARHRETELIDGEWHDDVAFAVLASEWRAARGVDR